MLPSFVHLYDDKSILHILTKEEYGFLIYAQMSETLSLRNIKKRLSTLVVKSFKTLHASCSLPFCSTDMCDSNIFKLSSKNSRYLLFFITITKHLQTVDHLNVLIISQMLEIFCLDNSDVD